MNADYYISNALDDEVTDEIKSNDLVVRDENNKIVSDSQTQFLLCPRCYKKDHIGTFKGNVFRCTFFGDFDHKDLRCCGNCDHFDIDPFTDDPFGECCCNEFMCYTRPSDVCEDWKYDGHVYDNRKRSFDE